MGRVRGEGREDEEGIGIVLMGSFKIDLATSEELKAVKVVFSDPETKEEVSLAVGDPSTCGLLMEVFSKVTIMMARMHEELPEGFHIVQAPSCNDPDCEKCNSPETKAH